MFEHYQWIDLTHPLNPAVPSWDGTCGFVSELVADYAQSCRVQKLTLAAGIGTHMDAPAHFIPGAAAIADIPLSQLIVPVCVLDVSGKAHADYEITPEDVSEFEHQFGPIAAGCLVLAYTGWSQYWTNPAHYRNVDRNGVRHFPAFTAATAKLLVARQVVGIGIDTLSPDSRDAAFPVHQVILGAGGYIIENVANAHLLPARGAYVLALPLKIVDGTESPMRLLGVLPATLTA